MAQPVWITPAGSLGVIPEGIFFQLPLLAEDPDGGSLKYEVIAGQLPPGIQCEENGLIVGIPKAVVSVQGVPLEVSEDVTSKFAARVYTTRVINGIEVIDRLADRTFTLTVTGQDAPEFITPPGTVGTYFDGTQLEGDTALQIEYTDTDPADSVIVRLVAGSLPPGLTINSRGLISGFISPASPISVTPGFSRDGQGYSQYPFDFVAQSTDANYEFVLEVTDGKASNLRTFNIEVYSRNSLTADNTSITADNTFVTADGTPVRTPILLTPTGSLGRVRSDNFYAFKFNGIDTDGDQIEYVITLGPGIGFDSATFNGQPGSYDREGFDRAPFTLPPGLTLDPNTGWLYGYIPDQGLTENTYTFAIQVRKASNPTVISDYYFFTITIVGDIDTEVTWLTPTNLGIIDTGSVSTLYVAAVNLAGIPLQYRLKSGSDSSLPQGLQLLPSGEIAGRVSFNTFALDGNTTTFDVTFNDLGFATVETETTFDRTFNFVVEAYGGGGLLSVNKTFTITINRLYNEPFENLYIQAMPPENDRDLITNFLQNTQIFPNDLIYRADDPNFGKANKVVYWHAYGLTSATYDDYVSALYENHYWKNLVLGSIETAQALDDDGNIIYEVVYSRIIDDLVNNEGVSVGKQVELPYPVTQENLDEIDVVYPNSLDNMRNQVIDTVGQISNILPRWMLSKQTNGRVLGFTPAWVIAYTKPGKANQIKYNIQTQFGTQLNKIDFKVDRYELDRLLSIHWDPVTDNWIPPGAETTFDRFGRPADLRYLGEVNFATDLAFIDINGRTLNYINSIGGIDGLVGGNPNGKTLIFATQENYNEPINSYNPGPITNSVAWTRYLITYGDSGFSADADLFDEAVIVPGEIEAAADPLLTNERMGVWQINVSSSGIVTLALVTDTLTNDYVTITDGDRYKTAQLYRPSVPGPGLTLINWQPLPSALAAETIFDGGSLRFIAPVDMYTNTQEFDRYLVFPKRNIIGPSGNNIVGWVNSSGQLVAWTNTSGLPVNWIDVDL